jgi:hypothetical protein
MRSLRYSGDGLIKTREESRDRLLLTRQHSTLDQDGQTRMWIDTAQSLSVESARLNNFSVCAQPRVGHGAQSGIGRLHTATLDLFKQFGERVGLGDRGNRALQNLIA